MLRSELSAERVSRVCATIAVPTWSSDGRFGKTLDGQKRDRDQRYRDARAAASREYLADIASDGPDCDDD
jgi:hypothetical protein